MLETKIVSVFSYSAYENKNPGFKFPSGRFTVNGRVLSRLPKNLEPAKVGKEFNEQSSLTNISPVNHSTFGRGER